MNLVVEQLSAHRAALLAGAVLSIDELEGRLRWLPLPPPGRSPSRP